MIAMPEAKSEDRERSGAVRVVVDMGKTRILKIANRVTKIGLVQFLGGTGQQASDPPRTKVTSEADYLFFPSFSLC